MTLTQKIIKEFRERFPISIDYPPITQMEVFTQMEIDARQKRALVRNEVQESFLLSSLHQVATEAIEAVRLEESPYISKLCKTPNGLDYCCTCEQAQGYCSCYTKNKGFNSAISEMEQKAKKFLENNFIS